MRRTIPSHLLPIAGLLLAIALPGRFFAAEGGEGAKPSTATAEDPCTAMKADKQKIQQDRIAGEVALKAQIAAMLAAPEKDKIDLMAAVIARMEAQQIAIEARKDALEEKMMQAMSPSDTSTAPKGCMMMGGMKDMKDMKDSTDAKGGTSSTDMPDMDKKPGTASSGK